MLLIATYFCKRGESDYYSKDPNKYLKVENINCNEQTNCESPNSCSTDRTICYCGKGRANYPFSGIRGRYCTYKQHKQLDSFLWELFTNIGVGHFILGHSWYFIFMQSISLVFFAAAFCWWLADLILFGTNKTRDEYHIPLSKW